MAKIPQNPKAPTTPAMVETLAENFINKTPKPVEQPTNITLRMPHDLLLRIDAAAAKEHITRSAWMKSKLSNLLDAEGN